MLAPMAYRQDATYRKDHNGIGFAFDDYCQIKADLKALESFMDNNILNLGSGNKPRRSRRQIGG